MTTILVMTRAWPHPPGEQFVDAEAVHWSGAGRRVIVMPWRASGEARVLTGAGTALPGLEVDLTLARASASSRRRSLLRSFASPLLWRELPGLLRNPSRARAVEVLQATRGTLLARDLLADWTREHGRVDVVYSYWFGVWTLGALALRRRRPDLVGAVATRVHGYDLHEDRHPAGYHALKRQLGPELDALLPVSVSGGALAVARFGVPPDRVHHAPLGTPLPVHLTPASSDGVLRVASIASALPVKRLSLLLEALELLATRRPDLSLHWTHLGGGPLLEGLRERAAALGRPNLTVVWTGQLVPEAVGAHLAANPVDLVVNTSSSEGVPVSLMEAMAHGIPVLATDVGAVHELVPRSGPGGELLPAHPSAAELADALERWGALSRDPVHRQAARQVVERGYDAARNAGLVIDLLDDLASAGPSSSSRPSSSRPSSSLPTPPPPSGTSGSNPEEPR